MAVTYRQYCQLPTRPSPALVWRCHGAVLSARPRRRAGGYLWALQAALHVVGIGLLGPFVLVGDDGPLPVEGLKVRLLLTLLALRAGRVVPADLLEDELWDGVPPPSARSALHAYVSRARVALRRAGPGVVLLGGRSGYALRASPDEIDA